MFVCLCAKSVCCSCALHFCMGVSAWLRLHPDIPTQQWEVRSGVSRDTLPNSHSLKDEEEKSWLNAQMYLTSLASAPVSTPPSLTDLLWQDKSNRPGYG